jgi:hypothetical protein
VLEGCLRLPDVLDTLSALQPSLAEIGLLGGPLPA